MVHIRLSFKIPLKYHCKVFLFLFRFFPMDPSMSELLVFVCVCVYPTVFPKWRLLFFAMGTAVKQEVMWPLFNGVVSRWNFGQSKKVIQDLQHAYTFVNFSDPPTQRSECSLSLTGSARLRFL